MSNTTSQTLVRLLSEASRIDETPAQASLEVTRTILYKMHSFIQYKMRRYVNYTQSNTIPHGSLDIRHWEKDGYLYFEAEWTLEGSGALSAGVVYALYQRGFDACVSKDPRKGHILVVTKDDYEHRRNITNTEDHPQ